MEEIKLYLNDNNLVGLDKGLDNLLNNELYFKLRSELYYSMVDEIYFQLGGEFK